MKNSSRNVYYIGPSGSYSEIIMEKTFSGEDFFAIPCDSFEDIVENTISDETSIGILPIENSITSDIHENIDPLFDNDLFILNETFLKIYLHLIGFKESSLSDIKHVYSNVRAFAQCKKFIKENNLVMHQTASTSGGKEYLLKSLGNSVAIIGGKNLLDNTPRLKIIEENIGDYRYNITRFICISYDKTLSLAKTKNKISIILKVPHTPGSLAGILSAIANIGLNLTKIESRPIPGTNWEYYFWVDGESIAGEVNVDNVIKLLKNKTEIYKIIGVYEKGGQLES